MEPKGAQTEPTNQDIESQGATKNKEHAKLSPKGGKVEPQVLQWSPKAPPNARKNTKKVSKVIIMHENGPQSFENIQEHINTNRQPTNQGNKERHESANNQTNEQTPTYTLTQTSTLTTRPLESSFELQTQTQTPAAGCSPKAT